MLCVAWGAEEDSSKAKKPGPPFFLIDTSDQLCLAGEEFKRCSIDSLFFVVGSPGKSYKRFNHADIRCHRHHQHHVGEKSLIELVCVDYRELSDKETSS